MCGRYASTTSAADLSELFDALDETDDGLAPDYNVAPTDPVPIVRISNSAGGRVLSRVSWGLVPAYAKDTRGGARMINARAETVATSGAFAPSFAKRRCLVPADGWYEWVRRAGTKQAYFMTLDSDVLALAGVWAVWGRAEQRVLTCSVVTTAALGELASVHDRMPLVLPPERWEEWLTAEPDAERLLTPPRADFIESIEIRPVGPEVGNVRNDGPSLIVRVDAPELGSSTDERADLTLF
jgi:putative SOS response-associated peptidase YedK